MVRVQVYSFCGCPMTWVEEEWHKYREKNCITDWDTDKDSEFMETVECQKT
jgi:hypothetical protein